MGDAGVEADRLKSRFVTSVSHELRTPLNAILGFTRVMLKDPGAALSEQHTGFVRAIQKSGTDLLQLVNTVLEAARLEAGRLELKPETFGSSCGRGATRRTSGWRCTTRAWASARRTSRASSAR